MVNQRVQGLERAQQIFIPPKAGNRLGINQKKDYHLWEIFGNVWEENHHKSPLSISVVFFLNSHNLLSCFIDLVLFFYMYLGILQSLKCVEHIL